MDDQGATGTYGASEIILMPDADGDMTLTFMDDGTTATRETFIWSNANDRWEFSDDVRVLNGLTASGNVRSGGGYSISSAGSAPEGDTFEFLDNLTAETGAIADGDVAQYLLIEDHAIFGTSPTLTWEFSAGEPLTTGVLVAEGGNLEVMGTAYFTGGTGLAGHTSIDVRTSGTTGQTDIGIDFQNSNLQTSEDYLLYLSGGIRWRADGLLQATTLIGSSEIRGGHFEASSVGNDTIINLLSDGANAAEDIVIAQDQAGSNPLLEIDGLSGRVTISSNTLQLFSAAAPPPAVPAEGDMYLDTNDSANGALMIYSNSAWRQVAAW
jgi:hypothetical protein